MRLRTPTRPRVLGALALACCLAGGLTACGGDEDTADDSSSESTESEGTTEETEPTEEVVEEVDAETEAFIAEANAVCEAYYPDINAAISYLDPMDPDLVTTDFLPLVEALQYDLEVVVPPADLETAYAEVLSLQMDQLTVITADPAQLFEMDGSEVNAAFDALGIDSCGSGSAAIPPSS